MYLAGLAWTFFRQSSQQTRMTRPLILTRCSSSLISQAQTAHLDVSFMAFSLLPVGHDANRTVVTQG